MINSNNRFTDKPSLPNDELDALLKQWHDSNAEIAIANRTELLKRLVEQRAISSIAVNAVSGKTDIEKTANQPARYRIMPAMRLVASIALVAFIGLLLVPNAQNTASADLVYLPDGGQLEARDQDGNLLGPCPLKHTDVNVEISGFFSRVTVTQHFKNIYNSKIEAVYTFPLSHNAAVDRMRMTIDNERIIDGEVKERQQARQIYESARRAGNVAALLEQERPNIFTQSVSNIEPGVTIDVEISYVETILPVDGVYSFAFPMTVAPRYIPGYAPPKRGIIPAELKHRQGIILRSPATINEVEIVDDREPEERDQPRIGMMITRPVGRSIYLEKLLSNAIAIRTPDATWWGEDKTILPDIAYAFDIIYTDGSTEFGVLLEDGTGHIAQRWFYVDQKAISRLSTGFETNTDQVTDASRITPMPVHPSTRAGHDISVTVSIDTGGPEIKSINSELHEIVAEKNDEELFRRTITLADQSEIPNRDFVLKWQVAEDSIEEATFVHADAQRFPGKPGFFTLILNPPARVEDAEVRARELIFVLDTSGSMKGEPIEKAKAVMTRAIDSMRDNDTFNIITFAGDTDILWDESRPNTNDNRSKALAWVNSRKGSGGTEMMTAIEAALNPNYKRTTDRPLTLKELADLPADGREITISIGVDQIENPPDFATEEKNSYGLRVSDDQQILTRGIKPLPPTRVSKQGALIRATGRWVTVEGRRVFVYSETTVNQIANNRMRICMFFTDGEVGNDMGIVAAVKKYAKTTRVFTFGIGNSINRYLLANMAHAGRGEVEFVAQNSDRGDAVERFARRIDSPVLTDIELEFSEGMEVTDVLPLSPAGLIPDLYDEKPLIIHGRYTKAGEGTLTIKGTTGQGEYKRTINLSFPEQAADHNTIATIWARAKIDELMNEDLNGIQLQNPTPDLKNEIVQLGEQFQIMSQFTSFVAVEKSRVTVKGQPILVTVPIELPNDADWSGFFCSDGKINLNTLHAAVKQIRNDHLPLNSELEWTLANTQELSELQSQLASGISDSERTQMIDSRLRHTRELQSQQKYDEAILTVNEIMVIDPSNEAAIALADIINTAALWESFRSSERTHEFGYSNQLQEDRLNTNAPDSELRDRVDKLESTLAKYEAKNTNKWLTEERAAEIRSLGGDVLRDADSRAELLQASNEGGWDNGFMLQSADGNFRLNLNGQMQVRWELNMIAGQNEVEDANRYGFENSRTKVTFYGIENSNGNSKAGNKADQTNHEKLPWMLDRVKQSDVNGTNIVDPDPKSTTGIMAYPEDWPNLSIRHNGGVNIHSNSLSKDRVNINSISINHADPTTIATELQLLLIDKKNSSAQNHKFIDYGRGAVAVPHSMYDTVDLSVNGKQVAESDQIPLLGDIPIVGAVFKKQLTDDTIQMFDNAPSLDLYSALSSDDEEQTRSFLVDVPYQKNELDHKKADPNPTIDTLKLLVSRINTIDKTLKDIESVIPRTDEQEQSQNQKTPAIFYLFNLHDPSVKQFFFERSVILINDLAQADYFDEAATLAKWIIEFNPNIKPAAEMQTVLIDEALPVDEKKSKVAKLSLAAENAIAQTILNAALELELERRVDGALLARVVNNAIQEFDTTESDSNATQDVIVCILLTGTDNATITGLRDAGLDVAEVVESTLLAVGTARLNQIPSIALAPGVRRVEEVATQH